MGPNSGRKLLHNPGVWGVGQVVCHRRWVGTPKLAFFQVVSRARFVKFLQSQNGHMAHACSFLAVDSLGSFFFDRPP